MGKINSKRKGKKGELEFSNLCKEHGFNTRRSQQYSGINGDADVVGLEGIHIEVKRVERLNIDKAMKQSIEDSKEGEIPIVAHRRNREEWLITMKAEDWFKLYNSYLKEDCLALNIELEEIIEMQSIELMKKDREIRELKKYKKYYIENPPESVIGIL